MAQRCSIEFVWGTVGQQLFILTNVFFLGDLNFEAIVKDIFVKFINAEISL